MGCLLVADVGGTNCRFALQGERLVWVSTKELVDTEAFLTSMTRELATPLASADALVVAMAGRCMTGLR